MSAAPTLHAAITGTLELALNQALDLDPAGRRDLMRALTGPVCFMVSEPLPLAITLQATRTGVQVAGVQAPDAALTLRGRPLAMVALALGDDRAIQDGRLRVEGDTALAHQFQRALARLDPDWEAALARYTGDVPAHLIGRQLRGRVRWVRNTLTSLGDSLEEYVHEETRTLPGRRELETTFSCIDDLALQQERLSARVDRLAATLRRQPGEAQ